MDLPSGVDEGRISPGPDPSGQSGPSSGPSSDKSESGGCSRVTGSGGKRGSHSHETHSSHIAHNESTASKLHLAFFDGCLMHSEKFETLYLYDPSSASTVSSSRNSSVTCCTDESIRSASTSQSISLAARPTPDVNTNAACASDTKTETEAVVILNRFVAEGSVGDVWEGFANLPGQSHPLHVAAKLAFRRRDVRSLQHEFSIYQKLGTNPELPVPTAYGCFQDELESDPHVCLLLLSWVDGHVPDSEEVQRFRSLIAAALKQVHRHGVIHGDLARRNLLIEPQDTGEAKIMLVDFDCAEVRPYKEEEGDDNVDMHALDEICQ